MAIVPLANVSADMEYTLLMTYSSWRRTDEACKCAESVFCACSPGDERLPSWSRTRPSSKHVVSGGLLTMIPHCCVQREHARGRAAWLAPAPLVTGAHLRGDEYVPGRSVQLRVASPSWSWICSNVERVVVSPELLTRQSSGSRAEEPCICAGGVLRRSPANERQSTGLQPISMGVYMCMQALSRSIASRSIFVCIDTCIYVHIYTVYLYVYTHICEYICAKLSEDSDSSGLCWSGG